MKTIGFIGLGLIGGSIARTIRKFHPDYRLLAFDKDRSALAEAVSLNVINGICDMTMSSYITVIIFFSVHL